MNQQLPSAATPLAIPPSVLTTLVKVIYVTIEAIDGCAFDSLTDGWIQDLPPANPKTVIRATVHNHLFAPFTGRILGMLDLQRLKPLGPAQIADGSMVFNSMPHGSQQAVAFELAEIAAEGSHTLTLLVQARSVVIRPQLPPIVVFATKARLDALYQAQTRYTGS